MFHLRLIVQKVLKIYKCYVSSLKNLLYFSDEEPVEPVIVSAPSEVHHRVDRDASPEEPEKGRFFIVTSSTTSTVTSTVTSTSYSATISATLSSCSANIVPPYKACATGKRRKRDAE